ncbi:hypothetical protein PoB_004886900 [Plakobranchus ocellatus]|uniref:Uncharacterized protein n=1 Tax=Plakobranchus ocellatus TaxID=259542 RepID=A0AAV4BVD0_9GAST|nr:hypothetical protein PoB_004886900 [Plakobranchus ocellatus]
MPAQNLQHKGKNGIKKLARKFCFPEKIAREKSPLCIPRSIRGVGGTVDSESTLRFCRALVFRYLCPGLTEGLKIYTVRACSKDEPFPMIGWFSGLEPQEDGNQSASWGRDLRNFTRDSVFMHNDQKAFGVGGHPSNQLKAATLKWI